MKRRTEKRMLALSLAGVMLLSTACSGGNGSSTTEAAESSSSAEAASSTESVASGQTEISGETVKLSMYPYDANLTSGTVSGHKAEFFAQNGIELEVWAYSDEKTNAILASGDLPDIMYVNAENLETMIEADMVLNLEDYLDQLPSLGEYMDVFDVALEYVREYRSAGTGELYALPTNVGDSSAKFSTVDSMERNAVKLRWDIYEEIGAPDINSFDDLIEVMAQMYETSPTDEAGNPFYGTILNTGSDAAYWMCMTLWYQWQGYSGDHLEYLLEADMANGTVKSILDKDSLYYQGLKWYNEVYRQGLMDPESINNDRATQKTKVDEGYAMVPSGYLPGWAPKYFEVYIPGTAAFYDYNSTYGDANKYIVINAKSQNIDACLKLLDMWCSPDDILRILCGRDGDIVDYDDNTATVSQKYLDYLTEHNGSGQGYILSDNEEMILWNTAFCINTGEPTAYTDGEGNARVYRVEQWPEVLAFSEDNDTYRSWQETTGYENYQSWLEAEGARVEVSPYKDVKTFCSLPDDSMQLTLAAIKDKVVNASWKMVYAGDEAEFESYWDQMVSDCEGLGAADIMEWRQNDITQATEKRDELAAQAE